MPEIKEGQMWPPLQHLLPGTQQPSYPGDKIQDLLGSPRILSRTGPHLFICPMFDTIQDGVTQWKAKLGKSSTSARMSDAERCLGNGIEV